MVRFSAGFELVYAWFAFGDQPVVECGHENLLLFGVPRKTDLQQALVNLSRDEYGLLYRLGFVGGARLRNHPLDKAGGRQAVERAASFKWLFHLILSNTALVNAAISSVAALPFVSNSVMPSPSAIASI